MPEAGRMASLSSPGSDSLRGLSFFSSPNCFVSALPARAGRRAVRARKDGRAAVRARARVPEVEERRSAAALEASGS